ncbi:hypothetical protein DK853_38605, partial [Klebsiella oxytoca]
MDGALSVSWKAAENATFYEVWYKEDGTGDFRQWAGRLSKTNTTISELTNGVTYAVCVTAGNSVGVSGYSRTALGTPAAVD